MHIELRVCGGSVALSRLREGADENRNRRIDDGRADFRIWGLGLGGLSLSQCVPGFQLQMPCVPSQSLKVWRRGSRTGSTSEVPLPPYSRVDDKETKNRHDGISLTYSLVIWFGTRKFTVAFARN